MTIKLKAFIEQSDRILVTSHISPDWDAYSSSLLLSRILRHNYPDKTIKASLEEDLDNLYFLPDSQSLKIAELPGVIKTFKPDLLILLDGNNFERFSRAGVRQIERLISENSIKTILIDHHEKTRISKVNLYINRGSPATTQDVYWLFIEKLRLNLPPSSEEIIMTGILGDTGRFLYQNKHHRETFEIVSRLLEAGLNVEKLNNRLTQYSLLELQTTAELAKNLLLSPKYSYTYVSDKFRNDWIKQGNKNLKLYCGAFANAYLRNVEGRQFGFMIYPDTIQGPGNYGVSLRAVNDTIDVQKIALSLGGSGHKPAAGAKIKADTAQRAVRVVQEAIAKTYPSLVE